MGSPSETNSPIASTLTMVQKILNLFWLAVIVISLVLSYVVLTRTTEAESKLLQLESELRRFSVKVYNHTVWIGTPEELNGMFLVEAVDERCTLFIQITHSRMRARAATS